MKDFVTYEQALALKELGFDEPCILLYRGLDTQPVCQMGYEFKTEKNSDYSDETNYWLTVPTFSQVFRWFREKHDLHSCVAPVYQDEISKVIVYWFWIQGFDSFEDEDINYKTYEEAELSCLQKLIEIVKNK